MKTVSIDELKSHLSSFLAEVAAGSRVTITKHRRAIAMLSAAGGEHVNVGSKFGRAALRPLLRAPTRGEYREVLDDDRRGAGARG